MTSQLWKRRVTTLALALAGTGAFYLLGLPLPFLFGPMAACLIAALAGVRLAGMGQVSIGARTILGVAVGTAITPELIARIPEMALSVALVPIYIVVIGLVGVPFYRRVAGFDPVTAWYAAMPGGLQDMVAFGQEAGGDPRALSLVHATRVLIIITIAPIVLTQLFGETLDNPVGEPASTLPVSEMAIMAVLALVGWKGGERVGLFGASIIGPLILAALLSLADLIHHRPPKEAILFAQFFIGAGIGVGYVGVTVAELRRVVLAGLLFVLVLAAIAAAFTEALYLSGLAPPADAFLAFAPGGQAEMIVLAIVAGADLGFVILHHLTRIFLVILGAPIVARLLQIRVDPDGRTGPNDPSRK